MTPYRRGPPTQIGGPLYNPPIVPTGIHSGKRGPKPRPPKEAARRRVEAQRRASRNWYRRHRMGRDLKRTISHKLPEVAHYVLDHGGLITNAQRLDNPHLKFIDACGIIHVEENLSAEELIRRYERSQTKCSTTSRQPTPAPCSTPCRKPKISKKQNSPTSP